MELEPSRVVERNFKPPERTNPSSPKIGGFLIVVAIGLIISLLKNLQNFAGSLVPFRGDVWERLTAPGSSAYSPFWKSALLFQLVAASAILVMTVIGLVLFFRKHRIFPIVIVVAIPLIFLLMLVGYYLDGLVPAIAASQDYVKEKHDLILRFIALHAWIPYFVLSKRVKQNFVQ